MTNGDKIRSMSDDELHKWLWWWTIKNLSSFLERGGAGCMDAVELRKWLVDEWEDAEEQ